MPLHISCIHTSLSCQKEERHSVHQKYQEFGQEEVMHVLKQSCVKGDNGFGLIQRKRMFRTSTNITMSTGCYTMTRIMTAKIFIAVM